MSAMDTALILAAANDNVADEEADYEATFTSTAGCGWRPGIIQGSPAAG